MARGDADNESDIDVLVTLRATPDRSPLGLKWFSLERQLSEKLGRGRTCHRTVPESPRPPVRRVGPHPPPWRQM